MLSLYDHPDVYIEALGEAENDETAFFASLLSGRRRVLSLGCGCGRLESVLSRDHDCAITGIDASDAMIREAQRRDPRGNYRVARMESFAAAETFDAAISGLLSFAYLTQPDDVRAAMQRMASCLVPGAPLILELPVAHRPVRLQGLEETHPLAQNGTYTFRYLDVATSSEWFTVLHTRIEVRWRGVEYGRECPLAVYTPDGLRRMLDDAGDFAAPLFYAPYVASLGTTEPPRECLRAVCVTARLGA